MSYVRAYANLIIDRADCDGYPLLLGAGRDWEASEPNDREFGFTPDVGISTTWKYADQFEFIRSLNGIAPIMRYTPADMSLSGWSQNGNPISGKWRESAKAGALKEVYLHYYDGLPNRYANGAHGVVQSNASYNPQVMCNIYRMGQAVNETEQPLFILYFLGSGNVAQYALVLPASAGSKSALETDMIAGSGDEQDVQPYLLGRPLSEAYWTVVSRLDNGGVPRMSDTGREPQLQQVKVEHLQGAILIRMSNMDREWVIADEWYSREGKRVSVGMEAGPIRIGCQGHTCMFNLQELTAPSSAVLRPREVFILGSKYNPTPNYIVVGDTPSGTGLSTAAEQDGDATRTRPAITFTSNGDARAILYAVQEYRPLTFGAGTSDQSQTNDNPNFVLDTLRGTISERYQGSTISATVHAQDGYSLSEVRPNAKVQVDVSTDHGSNIWRIFTGYVTPPDAELRPGPIDTRGTLEAGDYVESRLRHKQMGMHCSYGGNGTSSGWNIRSAFTHILNRAGVPSANILIDSEISLEGMGAGYYMPVPTLKGKRNLQFSWDTDVVQALDLLVSSVGMPSKVNPTKRRGLHWGASTNGLVFLRPAYEHTPGEYDLTLDDITATTEDRVMEFRHTRNLQDFVNYLHVMAGEGTDAVARILTAEESWNDISAQYFVGDLWARFYAYPDGADIDAIARQLWEELTTFHSVVSFTLDDHPWLLPDHEVRMSVGNAFVDEGDIYRIINKQWEITSNKRFRQTLDCVLVEEA